MARVRIFILFSCIFTCAFFFARLFLVKNNRPNVLLITIDALRPDHLGCYGYGRNTSPNLDALAGEGAMFTQVISASSSTISSVPSIMTSRYPHDHGVWDFGDVLNRHMPTLAYILRKNYFYTGMITAQLFPHFKIRKDFVSGIIKLDAKADKITDWAIEWVMRNKNKRFFLWIHYFDPHGPYDPPSPYSDMFLEDTRDTSGKATPILDNCRSGIGGTPRYQLQGSHQDKGYYVARYDGEIRFVDSQIYRLLETLSSLNLSDRTLIIVSSDHGESLGEHNYYFDHGGFLYDPLLKVPLIIRYPSYVPSQKRIATVVSSVDIVPTILDVLRIKRSRKLQGVSLLPLIRGNTDEYRQRFIISEYFEGHNSKFAVRANSWKLIYDRKTDGYECYYLDEDPQELTNRIGSEPEACKFLKQKLASCIEQAQLREKKSVGYR